VLSLAFVFLLVGYGTKVDLRRSTTGCRTRTRKAPTPISAVLSGLLLNVAIYAVVRCKVLVEGSLKSPLPSQMLMGFGLLSVVLAAFFSVAAARYQTAVRLFLHRAHGHRSRLLSAWVAPMATSRRSCT